MRRFILGWNIKGHARRFGAEIVNDADDFCVLGKAPAAECWGALTLLCGDLAWVRRRVVANKSSKRLP